MVTIHCYNNILISATSHYDSYLLIKLQHNCGHLFTLHLDFLAPVTSNNMVSLPWEVFAPWCRPGHHVGEAHFVLSRQGGVMHVVELLLSKSRQKQALPWNLKVTQSCHSSLWLTKTDGVTASCLIYFTSSSFLQTSAGIMFHYYTTQNHSCLKLTKMIPRTWKPLSNVSCHQSWIDTNLEKNSGRFWGVQTQIHSW